MTNRKHPKGNFIAGEHGKLQQSWWGEVESSMVVMSIKSHVTHCAKATKAQGSGFEQHPQRLRASLWRGVRLALYWQGSEAVL